VLKIRSLLEESYLPATANRMLSAPRGVLKECWHSGLVGMEAYRLAVDVEPVRGESEPRGRDLSAAELHGLLEACARSPLAAQHRQDSVSRRRRDAAFLSLLYASGLRRSAVSCESVEARAANRGPSRCPPQLSLPFRTGWKFAVMSRALSSVPCSRTVAWSATRSGSCRA
jgi:site-specific recombinase XerD